MTIKMELLSDTIFGNGMSIPGGEDISIQTDEMGFPYYKGSTFKGVFRDSLIKLLEWKGKSDSEIFEKVGEMLGHGGYDEDSDNKLVFSNFVLSDKVKETVLKEIGNSPSDICDSISNLRTFTALENGIAKEGSLRIARCVDKGMVFYGDLITNEDSEYNDLIVETLGMIKWVGSMKNRGFGKVRFSKVEE